MSDIDELQRRITAAMDRIASGIGDMGTAGANDGAALSTALEDEKLANAQLTERLRGLRARFDTVVDEAKQAGEAAHSRTVALDLELQRLRKANDQLRQSNAALRTANAEGVGDPHLINKAMMAELEALRAARAADVAEVTSIIGALTPLLGPSETPQEEDTDA
jgi:biopolymer transport protein ExbB/TolQ